LKKLEDEEKKLHGEHTTVVDDAQNGNLTFKHEINAAI
jgi:hypothetical protein